MILNGAIDTRNELSRPKLGGLDVIQVKIVSKLPKLEFSVCLVAAIFDSTVLKN